MASSKSDRTTDKPSLDDSPTFSVQELEVAFAIKRKSRELKKSDYPFTGFVCDYERRNKLYDFIYSSCRSSKLFENNFKVQIAYLDTEKSGRRHWSLIELQYSIVKDNNTLKILVLDSLGPQLSYNMAQILVNEAELNDSLDEIEGLSIKIYIPDVKLQHSGLGCATFTMDCASMLSTQDEYQNIYDFMDKQADGSDRVKIAKLENDFPVHCASLPPRLLRVAQSRAVITDDKILNSTSLINSKEDTFKASILKNCSFFDGQLPIPENITRNERILKKAMKWKNAIDIEMKTSRPEEFESTCAIDSLEDYAYSDGLSSERKRM
ncbi:hypothetical protein [Legionella waltersii]|uniref:Dot/Icm T4SS effector n=1 Tax=Legionella waltersii TaxID=66969 RepID=A0A0W1A4N6_9GAMM|nr:hypothetical protein [Legionella waltersii]KTD76333.1 hypothetical protein Lwal_2055 [Legionella waltersii]SNV13791.1 Uncharacterised protein [Legionella waltersii]